MLVNVPQSDGLTASFRFGEFAYDCGSRLLTRSGMKGHLSLKAQQLLQLLLLMRPRALSREELYDALWPSTFVCETNLAGIINELRRALGDDARTQRYIRTIHGFGYAFCGEVVSTVSVTTVAAALLCDEQRHPLYKGENLIGRADDCRVVIAAPTISRRHALITMDDGWCSIRDHDSKNGTFVNGKRVGSLPVPVTEDTPIAFGALAASIIFRKISSTASLKLNLGQLKREISDRITDV
jgi:DNA-binding winged helix-turn-helix (wHTH) protein